MHEQEGKTAPLHGGTELSCDLCIAGAGIAGLNALFAASRHLSRTDKIVLIDRHPEPAGMWLGAYDYVRLHQPHPVFTVGNIPWRGQPDRHHLATKGEVIEHLQHCYQVLRERTGLEGRFGHEYLSHEEGQGDRPITVFCQRMADGSKLTIRARRLVKAFGTGIQQNPPLALSSQDVRSVSPDNFDLFGAEMKSLQQPIYVVGGGKTGMDTVHALVKKLPTKKVNFVLGTGTMFINRDITLPRGGRRHWAGSTPLDVFRDGAFRFDGHNEIEVMRHFRERYAVSLNERCGHFLFGVLSARENREIRAGVQHVIQDHLEDVVDTANGPMMEFRSGARRPIEPGALIVNTTGYLKRRSKRNYEPYLSAGGNVLSIQPTSAVHFLTSQAAYFLTHLFLSNTLRGLPLYEAEVAALREQGGALFAPTAMAMVVHNSSILMQHVSRVAVRENGLNPLLMSPPHRRALSIAKLLWETKRRPDHLPNALNVVQRRLGIRLGLLASN